jgi:DNA-binding NarL/FixJ family response regulator
VIRILLADDQPLFRAGIAMVVDSQPDMQVVGQADDGLQAVELATTLRPDLILMDVRMPHLDGVSATERLMARPDTTTKVLVLTTFDLDDAVASAIEAGASGFLLKDSRPEMLLESIRAVAAGNQVLAASATRTLFATVRSGARRSPGREYDALTAREKEILALAAAGMSNAEIAQREFISEATVKTHISHLLTKLDARDRIGLVVYAYECGLI